MVSSVRRSRAERAFFLLLLTGVNLSVHHEGPIRRKKIVRRVSEKKCKKMYAHAIFLIFWVFFLLRFWAFLTKGSSKHGKKMFYGQSIGISFNKPAIKTFLMRIDLLQLFHSVLGVSWYGD